MKRSVTVEVAGLKFQLKTDADEAYVKSLARYVTEKMDEARHSARSAPTQHIALLAALNVADELFQSKRDGKEFRQKVREKSRSILEILEKEAKR